MFLGLRRCSRDSNCRVPPATSGIQTSFTQELCQDIITWVSTPIPCNPAALRTRIDQADRLFSQVTTHHDAVVTGHNAILAQQDQALSQAQDTIASLNEEIRQAEKEAAIDRSTMRALSARVPAPGDGTSRLIPVSDRVMFDGNKEDLEAFLDPLVNKLRDDAAQFTN